MGKSFWKIKCPLVLMIKLFRNQIYLWTPWLKWGSENNQSAMTDPVVKPLLSRNFDKNAWERIPVHNFHTVKYDHALKISSNQLWSNFFSESVHLTKKMLNFWQKLWFRSRFIVLFHNVNRKNVSRMTHLSFWLNIGIGMHLDGKLVMWQGW